MTFLKVWENSWLIGEIIRKTELYSQLNNDKNTKFCNLLGYSYCDTYGKASKRKINPRKRIEINNNFNMTRQ